MSGLDAGHQTRWRGAEDRPLAMLPVASARGEVLHGQHTACARPDLLVRRTAASCEGKYGEDEAREGRVVAWCVVTSSGQQGELGLSVRQIRG